jgi:hypothetical protein
VKLLELSSKFGKNISFLKHQKSTKEVRNHRLNSVFVLELWHTAALESSIFDRPLSSSDFQSLARPVLMRAWDSADTGRFTRSIFSDVTLRPWFEGQKVERRFVCTVSTVLSGYCSVRSHLARF